MQLRLLQKFEYQKKGNELFQRLYSKYSQIFYFGCFYSIKSHAPIIVNGPKGV